MPTARTCDPNATRRPMCKYTTMIDLARRRTVRPRASVSALVVHQPGAKPRLARRDVQSAALRVSRRSAPHARADLKAGSRDRASAARCPSAPMRATKSSGSPWLVSREGVSREGRTRARVHSRLSGGVRSRATRVAYGVGGGRDVQVGAQGTVVRAVLQVSGPYSARRSREAAMSCSGQSRVLREPRHRARGQHIDLFDGQR
jgi:hypothetical protein